MPITKVSNVITETPVTQADRAARTAVYIDSDFSLCDESDVLKQMKFDVTPMAAGKTVTFQAGAGSSDVVITLPSSSASFPASPATQLASNPSTGQTITVEAGTTTLIIDGSGSDAGAWTLALPTSPTDGQTITSIGTSISNIGAVTVTSGSASRDSNGFTGVDFSSKRLYVFTYRSANTTWYVGY